MAELTTIARPYAKAAFEHAVAAEQLGQWSQMLALLANITGQEKVAVLLASPALTAQQRVAAVLDICGEEINVTGSNFVHVVGENHRLPLMAEISEQFEHLKAQWEKTADVEITTASELNPETLEKFKRALKARLERDVRVQVAVDEALIGGAIIRAGDTVIDGSVRGRLSKLNETLIP